MRLLRLYNTWQISLVLHHVQVNINIVKSRNDTRVRQTTNPEIVYLSMFVNGFTIWITMKNVCLAYRVSVTADYNMDLVIALEMSRLQMIEDEMKQKQKEENK